MVTPTYMSEDSARRIADANNANDEEWSYRAVLRWAGSDGWAVAVYDEAGAFLGYL